MKAARIKMWRVWGRKEEPPRVIGAPDAASAARVSALYCWRHLGWQIWPHVFRVELDHVSDGSPFTPEAHSVRVFLNMLPDFTAEVLS